MVYGRTGYAREGNSTAQSLEHGAIPLVRAIFVGLALIGLYLTYTLLSNSLAQRARIVEKLDFSRGRVTASRALPPAYTGCV